MAYLWAIKCAVKANKGAQFLYRMHDSHGTLIFSLQDISSVISISSQNSYHKFFKKIKQEENVGYF